MADDVSGRVPRTAQNPKSLKRIQVPVRHAVEFKPGRLMKDETE